MFLTLVFASRRVAEEQLHHVPLNGASDLDLTNGSGSMAPVTVLVWFLC